jgi:tetratricopeptide (TPR) repeat protein
VDQASRARLIRTFTLSLTGLALGAVASIAGMSGQGWSAGTAVLVTGGVWAIAFFGPLAFSALGGAAANRIHNPSGRSTPSRREYSHAESLVARGLHEEALEAFEVAIAEDPSDPTPYLRIARIHRDRLQRYEDAAQWLKRCIEQSAASAGAAHLATRELVELYANKLNEPRRAAPLLARLAEERAGTPEGAWATEELARVKATIADEERRD